LLNEASKDTIVLRITIELVPGGVEQLAKVIGRGTIGNLSALADLSNYKCSFEENSWNNRLRGPYTGMLVKWPRNDHGAWEIVHAALSSALNSRWSAEEIK
jgi:hypothetical protein